VIVEVIFLLNMKYKWRRRMEIRVLGCYGAQFPGYNTTSFLLNRNLLVDAGTVTSVLTPEEQINIDQILVTHAHLDHIKDIAFLADNLQLQKTHPVGIVTTQGIIDIIRANLFNNVVWPDFSTIPDAKNPVIRFQPIEPGKPYSLNDMKITAVEVNHTVETVAYVIEYEGCSVIFVGDTGPTEDIWRVANKLKKVNAVFIETSFPNDMKDIAGATGHFTPETLNDELEKLKIQTPDIYLYHLKPQYYDVIVKEIGLLKKRNIQVLREGEIIRI
jgi:ribonuclease BN (tRNA processing enzyme)